MQRRTFLRYGLAAPLVLTSLRSRADSLLYPHGKTYAVSFSIDDGFWDSTQQFLSLFEQYDTKATFNLVTHWVTPKLGEIDDSYNQGASHGAWSDWKTVLDAGHEIASHSCTHPALPTVPLEQVKRELIMSKKRITNRLNLRGQKTFAFPYNQSSPQVKAEVRKHYMAAREGTRTGEINTLDDFDLYGVRSWWPLVDTTAEEIQAQIDRAKESNGWLVIGLHGMNGEGWHPITTEKMSRVLQDLYRRDDVYIHTFKDIAIRWKKAT